MKFVSYHDKEFQFPALAFTMGFCQAMGGIAAEVLCIIFLCSLNNTIDCLIRFMALGMLANIDNFYAVHSTILLK
jgi:hypothetical protein